MIVDEIKPNGFCGGVKKAIKMINECLSNPNTPKPIYMLGYLVHNKKIVSSYQDEVILVQDNYLKFLDTFVCGTIIFTAHGISPTIKNKVLALMQTNNAINVIDTTCINVAKIHDIIKLYIKKDCENYVVVVGNSNHPEVMGFLGISDRVVLYKPNLEIPKNALVVNQTTLVYDEVQKIFETIKEKNPTAFMSEEICTATRLRQKALKDSLDDYDCFLVIGDLLSNNCRSLFEILRSTSKKAYQIEDITELNNIDFSSLQKIGVTAGASTPPCVVNEIIRELKTYHPNKVFTSILTNSDYRKL